MKNGDVLLASLPQGDGIFKNRTAPQALAVRIYHP
jgi:hypothetical protein